MMFRESKRVAVDRNGLPAGVNRLIPTLKAAGAFDILELPIAKIVA